MQTDLRTDMHSDHLHRCHNLPRLEQLMLQTA
jgi:hypothetical protein